MLKPSPEVAIIVPCHNKVDFLEATLHSICSQTFSRWEAIVVDDASTDGSTELIHRFCHSDKRFRTFSTGTRSIGGSGARNLGATNTAAAYLVFLDADDLLESNALSNRLAAIADSSDDFQVWPGTTFFNTPGDRVDNGLWKPQAKCDHLKRFLTHELPWHTSSPIWRRTFFERIGGFDRKYPRLQDVEFHTRALLNGAKYSVHECADVDFFYRVSPNRHKSTTGDMAYKYVRATLKYAQNISASISASEAHRGNERELRRWLSGTLLAVLVRLAVDHKSGELNDDDYDVHSSTILDSPITRELVGPSKLYLLRLLTDTRLLSRRGIPRLTRGIITTVG